MEWLSVSKTGLIQADGLVCSSHIMCPVFQLYEKRGGLKVDVDKKTQAIFDLGKDMEDVVIRQIKENVDCKVESQVSVQADVYPNLRWGGKIDVVVGELPDIELIEIKTLTTASGVANMFVKPEPKVEHLAQLTSYMYLYKEVKGLDFLPYGRLLYVAGVDVEAEGRFSKNIRKGETLSFLVAVKDDVLTLQIETEEGKSVFSAYRPVHTFRFLEFMNWVLEDNRYACETPKGTVSKGSACFFCPVREACTLLVPLYAKGLKSEDELLKGIKGTVKTESSDDVPF